MPAPNRPSLARFDASYRRRHAIARLGGVDEAGRGPLAGPVVAACVVLVPGARLPGVGDSKTLAADQREARVPTILEQAAAWGLGWATPAEIDRLNILQATLLAAQRAIARLSIPPEFLLTDYLRLPDPPCPQEPLVKGDARSLAVAAASILAKVARDRIMTALDAEYPPYDFARNKGYGTPTHWAALATHGPSTLHRLTFRGVAPEPFFGAESSRRPRLRCRSLSSLPIGPPSASPVDSAVTTTPPDPAEAPDWRHLLTADPAKLSPHAYLPEVEWQLASTP